MIASRVPVIVNKVAIIVDAALSATAMIPRTDSVAVISPNGFISVLTSPGWMRRKMMLSSS